MNTWIYEYTWYYGIYYIILHGIYYGIKMYFVMRTIYYC